MEISLVYCDKQQNDMFTNLLEEFVSVIMCIRREMKSLPTNVCRISFSHCSYFENAFVGLTNSLII